MRGFAGWVGGNHTYEEMKRQLKLMGGCLNAPETQSVYLPCGAMIGPKSAPMQILQNGTACIALMGQVFWHHKRMPNSYRLSLEEILEAYLHQGAQCLNTFQGQYAIAIILAEHNEVFLACDHFNTFPIYYAQHNDHFVFANQLNALLSHMALKPSLSKQAIFDYLYHHFIPSPATIYNDMSRVQAGHYVLHRKNRTLSVPYWQCASFPKGAFYSKSKNLLKEHLTNAVKKYHHKNSGAFLSGGLDSSTVAGIMSTLQEEPVPAFTIGFDQDQYDESDYAKLVAKHFGLKHYHQVLTADDLYQAIPKIITNMGQPFGNASLIGAYFCSKLAKENGIDTLLAGDGGDELFGGNSRYQTHYWYHKYLQIPKLVRFLAVEGWISAFSEDNPFGLIRKAKKFSALSKLSIPEREARTNLLNYIGKTQVLSKDLLEQVDSMAPLNALKSSYQEASGKSWLNKLLCMDMKWILADNDIQKVRMSCDMNQCQVYFPMLDEPLVKFAMKLPDSYKVGKHGLRPFYKKSLGDFLPKALMNKPKHGFGVPFGAWTLTHKPLQHFVFDNLNQLKQTNIINPDFIDQLKDKLLAEHPGFYGVMAWDLLTLSLWLQENKIKNQNFQSNEIIVETSEIS